MSIPRISGAAGAILCCAQIKSHRVKGGLSKQVVHLEAYDGRKRLRLPVIGWGGMVSFLMGEKPVRVTVRNTSLDADGECRVHLDVAVDATEGTRCVIAVGDALDVAQAYGGMVTSGWSFQTQLTELKSRRSTADQEQSTQRRARAAPILRRRTALSRSLACIEVEWF